MHQLSAVDPVRRTALCSVCGPTKIRVKHPRSWRCSTRAAQLDKVHYARRPKGFSHPKYRKMRKDKCEGCGFVPKHRCQLDAHHKDGNHQNDDPDNIQTLCANCHRLITWTGAL